MSIKKLRRLTEREEAYAQEVVLNGGVKLKAYQAAGYSQTMGVDKQSISADKIFNRPNVHLRIKELRSKADSIASEGFSFSVKDRLQRLDDLYVMGTEQVTNERGIKSYQSLSVAKQSLEVMNAMLGVGDEGSQSESLTIEFKVNSPVTDVRVTSGT